MKPDLRMISPSALASLSPDESYAFSVYCLSLLDSLLRDASVTGLCRDLGYEMLVPDVQTALETCAAGLASEPSPELAGAVRSAVSRGQDVRERQGDRTKPSFPDTIATEHLYYHIPLQVSLACLEAIRNDAFAVMTSVYAALRLSAVFAEDGMGPVSIRDAINEVRSDSVREFKRAYGYVKGKSRGKESGRLSAFCTGFTQEISRCPVPSLPDADLADEDPPSVSSSRAAAGNRPERKTSSLTTQASFSYQVFISFKNLSANGEPTRDSELAESLYHFLQDEGLAVFFSNLSLESLGQSAYSKAIDRALDSSQILVVVSTDPAHLESDWVRYEWDSFFNDIISGIKPNGRVFAYVNGVDTRQLPRKLRQAQVFHDDRGERDRLRNFVRNALT